MCINGMIDFQVPMLGCFKVSCASPRRRTVSSMKLLHLNLGWFRLQQHAWPVWHHWDRLTAVEFPHLSGFFTRCRQFVSRCCLVFLLFWDHLRRHRHEKHETALECAHIKMARKTFEVGMPTGSQFGGSTAQWCGDKFTPGVSPGQIPRCHDTHTTPHYLCRHNVTV